MKCNSQPLLASSKPLSVIRRGTERSECLRACRAKGTDPQIQPNPNPSPLGEGFMPPPYPLHGSGSESCWSAVPKYHPFFSIQNRSYFLIVFRCHFGSILGPFWAPTWGHFSPFWRPSSAKFALKSVMEAYQHQKLQFSGKPTKTCEKTIKITPRWLLKQPKIDPRRLQDGLGGRLFVS